MSCQVDTSDHFSHFDSTITPWHFLRFDERTWKLVNSELLYQNRLRAPSYAALAASVGFDICAVALGFPEGSGQLAVPMPLVHHTFQQWEDRRDLLATTLDLVCVKAPSFHEQPREHLSGSESLDI